MKYLITYHYDVWGNAEDGYEVNDSRAAGTVDLTESMSDAEVCAAACDASGMQLTKALEVVSSDGSMLGIDTVDGYPVFTLIAEGE